MLDECFHHSSFCLHLYPLLASRFHRGDADEILWKGVCGKGLRRHLDKAHEGASEVGEIASAAVHDRSGSYYDAPKSRDDINRLLNAATTGDDILGDEETLAGNHLEAAHDEGAVPVFLDKDMTGAEMAGHLLADDNSSHSGGDDCRLLAIDLSVEGAELFRQFPADLSGDRGILQEQGALEELAAVEAGTKDEVAVKEGSGLFEEGEDVGHRGKVKWWKS